MSTNGQPSREDLFREFQQLTSRGLTPSEIGRITGFSRSHVDRVLKDPTGERTREQSRRSNRKVRWRDRFERDEIRQGGKLPAARCPAAPRRDRDFDVSGSNGVRFVVIPIGLPSRPTEGDSRPGWTVFDTLYKHRVGLLRTNWPSAWDDCRYYNAREDQEAA